MLPSRHREIHALLDRLGADGAAERDLAVARLRLLGPRVLAPLGEWLPGAGAQARAEALRVLEGSPEPRALELVLALCHDATPAVAERAAETAAAFGLPAAGAVLRELLRGVHPNVRRAAATGLLQLQAAGVVEALDALLALLLDERRDPALRLIAFEALAGLPRAERQALLARLAQGRPGELAERARRALGGASEPRPAREKAPAPDPESVRTRLQAQPTPAQVTRLARQLLEWGAPGAIPLLHEALQALAPGRDQRRGEARAAVHQALALLDSRIALYDLRERLAARPVHGLERLLAAAERIGDASLAGLLPRLSVELPEAREACGRALGAIVQRQRLRRGNRAFKDLPPAERRALEALWPGARR